MKRLITSESVSKGHPDKIADQISDAILDEYLKGDPNSKVAVETMVKDKNVVIGGEVKSKVKIDFDNVIKKTVEKIGYNDPKYGFYHECLNIINLISNQSIEINKAVEKNELTSGDQGFMVGYATDETPTMMPIGMYVSKKIVDHFYKKEGLGPDAKSQVTISENSDKYIHTILVSTMHDKNILLKDLRKIVSNDILTNNIGLHKDIFSLITDKTKIVINPAGSWHIGGPHSDCGLTGRKIVVDQYGPYSPVGGGAFSGKDSSKTDRSGAYLARYIAKNIVKTGLTKKCKVEIAYMIGRTKPASLNIDTFGMYDDEKLIKIVEKIFPLKPNDIINYFKLNTPIFIMTSDGHFGNHNLPWEKTDLAEKILKLTSTLE